MFAGGGRLPGVSVPPSHPSCKARQLRWAPGQLSVRAMVADGGAAAARVSAGGCEDHDEARMVEASFGSSCGPLLRCVCHADKLWGQGISRSRFGTLLK